jgi:hypothetical protein
VYYFGKVAFSGILGANNFKSFLQVEYVARGIADGGTVNYD